MSRFVVDCKILLEKVRHSSGLHAKTRGVNELFSFLHRNISSWFDNAKMIRVIYAKSRRFHEDIQDRLNPRTRQQTKLKESTLSLLKKMERMLSLESSLGRNLMRIS